MKKILFALLAVCIIASSLVVSTSAAAEIPTDGLIGNYHFDGNLKNAVDDSEGTPMVSGSGTWGEGLYEIDDPERYWFHGVDGGYAFYCGDGDGAQLMNPGEGDWTIGVWILETDNAGIHPYVWYGQQKQNPENWIGIWNVCITKDGEPWDRKGLSIGSNDADAHRYGIVPEEAAKYDEESEVILQWTHAVMVAVLDEDTNTYTITMYVNGEKVGENSGFPNPSTGDAETNGDYIYINSVNAWTDPASGGALDELVVYNRALSADEVKTLYSAYGTPATYESFEAIDISGGETPADTETPKPNDTDAPKNDKADDTNAPKDDKADGNTTTAAPEEEGGCGSTMGAAAAIVALVSVLGCAIIKKH